MVQRRADSLARNLWRTLSDRLMSQRLKITRLGTVLKASSPSREAPSWLSFIRLAWADPHSLNLCLDTKRQHVQNTPWAWRVQACQMQHIYLYSIQNRGMLLPSWSQLKELLSHEACDVMHFCAWVFFMFKWGCVIGGANLINFPAVTQLC